MNPQYIKEEKLSELIDRSLDQEDFDVSLLDIILYSLTNAL
jgi:hypothetical protein